MQLINHHIKKYVNKKKKMETNIYLQTKKVKCMTLWNAWLFDWLMIHLAMCNLLEKFTWFYWIRFHIMQLMNHHIENIFESTNMLQQMLQPTEQMQCRSITELMNHPNQKYTLVKHKKHDLLQKR